MLDRASNPMGKFDAVVLVQGESAMLALEKKAVGARLG
jgi:hypothetical protein